MSEQFPNLVKDITINIQKAHTLGAFPGRPVVKTLPSNAEGVGSIPGRGAKIPHASGPKNQNIKQKQYCNKFNKDFKKKLKKKKQNSNSKEEELRDPHQNTL